MDKPKLKVVLPNGTPPSDMIRVLTALEALEDKFDIAVDFERTAGQGQDGIQLRDPLPIPPAHQVGRTALDLINEKIPGSEEEDVESRRRVVRDDS